MGSQLVFDYDQVESVAPPSPPDFVVEVIRSDRRKKTSQARLVGNRLVVRIPGRSTRAQEAEMIEHFTDVFRRRSQSQGIDLETRAESLARQFDLPEPSSVRWVSNQRDRWGSCTPSDRTIRLSDRMSGFPQWVIDYVLVHELSHLRVSGHNDDFWGLVNRYPLTERARGYLIAQASMVR